MRRMMLALAAVLASSAAPAVEQMEAKGRVETVILYRGQALATRAVPFDAPAGAVELTIPDLPESVCGDTLFASGGKDIQIRAVRYRATAVSAAPDDDARKLDDKIRAVEKKIREHDSLQGVIGQQQAYMDKLESFVAPTAQVEMSKGVLNAEVLEKITVATFERRRQLAKEILAQSEETRELKEQLALLQRQREEMARSRSNTKREAVVFLDKAVAGKGEIRLNYLVRNATWSPTYNIRGGAVVGKVNVEYGALVSQVSGEDWDAVALTLSTAGAQTVADGPALAPMRLLLGKAPVDYGSSQVFEQKIVMSKSNLRQAQTAQMSNLGFRNQADAQWDMNKWAINGQNLELAARGDDVAILRRMVRPQGSGLSANYSLEGKVSLAGRKDNQMVQIATLTMPATFYHEAVPLLGEQVYRYAEVSNESAIALLEGRGNVYLNGEFAGAASVPMVARGQRVVVGFGTNPQLRAWREFISREERGHVFGGNKEVTYKYRLVLENFSDAAIGVRLLDRIPVQTEEIQVKVGQTTVPLSQDPEYARALRPQGVLRWDIEVPARASAGSAKTLEYSVILEFDKDLHIIVPSEEGQAAPQMKAQFEELLQERMQAK